jgi:hypothetical protein
MYLSVKLNVPHSSHLAANTGDAFLTNLSADLEDFAAAL